MDPFSIILAFSAALAASAAVQVHQQSKQSGYDRAWMDYIGLNQGTMTPQQLVDADRAMEQGELPPGHIWIDENTAIPQDALLDMQSAAFDATSGENLIGLGETFDFGILPTDEEASRRMLRYFAPHAGQVRWVKQLSGHDARGEWKTLLFSKPLPVRFPSQILANHVEVVFNTGFGPNAFQVNAEIPVQVLEMRPELHQIVGPAEQNGPFPAEGRWIYHTGTVAVGTIDEFDPDNEFNFDDYPEDL